MSEYSVVGTDIPRVDGLEKATGEANFSTDIQLPGMLCGKMKRSPYPFARIINIDTDKARKLRGVKAVITARDVTQFPYGPGAADEFPLADGYARYIGDEVAAVAAVDYETAEEALGLIDVEYEELTPVLDPEKATSPGAPAIHPEREDVKQNIAFHLEFVRGEGEAAFKQADLVIEDRFTTQPQHHAYLEPHSCIARWNSSDKLEIWGSTQAPFRARMLLARALGIPEHQIRIIQPYVGGGFGGKVYLSRNFPISALLAKKAGKPVKIVYTREEDFTSGRPRISETIDLRLGFKKDGTMVAKSVVATADSGAYLGCCPAVVTTSLIRPDCVYRLANIKAAANVIYTNKIPRTAYRGYGNSEMLFAMESLIDMAAEKLGIDPMDIRLKNSSQTGDVTVHGWILNSCGLAESIKLSADKAGWKNKRQQNKDNQGIGMACQVHVSGQRAMHPLYDGSAAVINIDQYGKVKIISGESEMGQGMLTVFTQIAAEEIGVKLDDITILPVDSQYSPFALGAWASRTTQLAGNAVIMAAQDARRQLLEQAALQLDCKPADLGIKDSIIYLKKDPEKLSTVSKVAFRAVFEAGGVPIMGRGAYTVPDYVVVPEKGTFYGNYSLGYSFSTQVAEVEVDPETGKVDVLNMWVGQDVGRALNPRLCEGQIEGGVLQGIGGTLTEDYKWNGGKIMNANFTDYKIPISADIPAIHCSLIESDNPGSPYGAKSIGEAVINPVGPAIANAVYNATGLRVKSLPLSMEKVNRAFRETSPK